MQIGKSILYYDENGNLDHVVFTPSIVVDLSNKDLAQFSKLTASSEDDIALAASAAISTWFQKTNEIELADRDSWKIETKVVKCYRDPESNHILRCELTHHFVKINNDTFII